MTETLLLPDTSQERETDARPFRVARNKGAMAEEGEKLQFPVV